MNRDRYIAVFIQVSLSYRKERVKIHAIRRMKDSPNNNTWYSDEDTEDRNTTIRAAPDSRLGLNGRPHITIIIITSTIDTIKIMTFPIQYQADVLWQLNRISGRS